MMLCFLIFFMTGVVGSAGDISASSHVDGHFGINTFLALSLKYAQTVNQSSCWVCTHTPFTAIGRIPLGVIPFTQSEMLGVWKHADWFKRVMSNNWGPAIGYRGADPTDICYKDVSSPGCPTIQTYIDSLGVEVESWRGAYLPPFNTTSFSFLGLPPRLVVTRPPDGWLCIERTPSAVLRRQWMSMFVKVGWSQCSQIADLSACDGSDFSLCTMSANLTLSNGSVAGFHANALGNIGSTGMVAPNGTYFICGPNAYAMLPPFWMGSCYLGYVVPHIRHSLEPPFAKLHRRSISESERFFAIAFPSYGTAKLAQEVITMASSLEALANLTADGFTGMSAEMVAMRTVAMQNRVALDYLLAAQGGTCAVVGAECCTYIPDETDGV
ncbi:uncharacterized protein LOC114840714 [Esox lucius]|uniref:uncharacterized protein LOC114840714 n=1 Tax=Esox lucius TaxID=8010 RepID=UPI0014772180|nr:uncharacterized protein LOC114840714 [Esox lucius]